MIARILIDQAETPGGGKELRLYQHDKDFYIIAGSDVLMDSRMHASEETMARVATKRISKRKRPRVLIAGLGMGFTLRAALDGLPATAEVVMAELVPTVVKWNRGLLGDLAGHPLRDKRVNCREEDAISIIKESKKRYDAILLDVDNGPTGMFGQSNDWFYRFSGLHAMKASLEPKGVLALWSAGPDVTFTARLNKVGFEVEEIRCRARPGNKGSHHLIWIATKR